jgi:hypothetical protein
VSKPADSPVRRLARILAIAYLRVLAARKEQNRLDVARHDEAPLPGTKTRRMARG